MEEILASIRRIIADDDGLPLTRKDRLDRLRVEPEPPAAPEELAPALAAQDNAYPAPVLERRDDWRREPAMEPPRLVEAAHAEASAEVAEPAEEEEAYDSEAYDYDREAADDKDGAGDEAYAYAVEEPAQDPAPLVSPDAAAAIAAQFQTLAASMVINDSGLLHRYAQEMLRPMLKQWLDDNLPVIVERLVRSEIERVARGGRR